MGLYIFWVNSYSEQVLMDLRTITNDDGITLEGDPIEFNGDTY